MAEDHRCIRILASRHLEPGQIARRNVLHLALEFEFHLALRRADAQARKRIDDGAQTVVAGQILLPGLRRVAVHLPDEIHIVVAAQHRLDFARQLQRLVGRPSRQHPRMHQQMTVLQMRQLLPAQPVQQFIPIRRGENLVQRIALVQLADARRHRDQMQIVIAQHRDRAVAQRLHQAQHLQRTRPAIDQIADEPELVLCRVETDLLQQLLQFFVTPLNVAYRINRH